MEYLTDLAGMPYEYFWYAPTGELIEHQQQGNAGFNTPFQFSARTYDAIPELVYMGARYYSPQFSIFTSPDPMRAYRSWISPYNYVQNNPVMRQDPTGMLDGGILEEGVPGEPKVKKDSDETSGCLDEVVVLAKAPSKLMSFFYRAKNWVKQKDNYELLIGVLPFAGSLYDIARGIYDGDYYQMGFGLVMLGTELFTLGLGGATARLVLKASFKGGGGKVAFKSAGERVGKFFRKTFTRAERKAGKNSVKRDSQPFEEFIDNGGYGRKAEGAAKAVNFNKTSLFSKYERHIFSQKHIKNGIMDLGSSRKDIMSKIGGVIDNNISNLKEGDNFILQKINDHDATIKVFVKDGNIISVDAYKGPPKSLYGNVIK